MSGDLLCTSGMNLLKWLARRVTYPRRVLRQLDRNPAVGAAAANLLPDLVEAAARTIDTKVNDAGANAALKDAFAIAIGQILGSRRNA